MFPLPPHPEPLGHGSLPRGTAALQAARFILQSERLGNSGSQNMKKIILAVVLLAGVGLVGWQVYQKVVASQKGNGQKRRAVKVAVEAKAVERGAIRDIHEFTGTLYPRSQFVVAPKIAGRLKKLMFNIGDRLEPGQLIAVLDDDEFVQQVDQAQAELQVAKANLEERQNSLDIAKREYDRTVVLRSKKIASESELDTAASNYKTQEAKLKVALAQVVQNEAALKVAQVRLSYTQIKVPPKEKDEYRVVGERYVHEGAMLAANTPIVSILDIHKLVAAIHVIERDYSKIRMGMHAIVSTDAYPGKTFSGKIIRMAPLLQEKSREARIEIEIANNEILLKPGMFVRVLLEFERHDNAVIVPLDALAKREGRQGVFMVDEQQQTARFVAVETGITNGQRVEVVNPDLSGLVITLGHHLLEDGSAVILPGEKSQERKRKDSQKPTSGERKKAKSRPEAKP